MLKKLMVQRALVGLVLFLLMATTGYPAVQYSNDFENPSSTDVQTAWPEWIKFEGGTDMRAVNGRIEWYSGGNNQQWIRLDQAVPTDYSFEFDFFYQTGINGRFSVWPFCLPGDSIERRNYFLRANTHYYNGADTIPSEGPRDLTLPLGSMPHRMRFEISGDHVVFLYKDRGQGGWILVDERDFPSVGEASRFIQLGYNHDGGTGGVHYIDNFVLSYSSENLFSYKNNFENPSSSDVQEAWPEWVKFAGATDMRAVNGRIEWLNGGGNIQWIRLDKELPMNYVMEFDFFHPADVNARFSVWPLVKPGEDIFARHNYFLRANTHYFNGADTVPSEGPRDMTLPVGSPPHRLRFEVTGDHVVFLYKDRGQGGWILVDERDFPPFGDGPRYVQLGNNHDSGTAGVHYVDNFEIRGLASNRAVVDRSIGLDTFEANTPVPVSLTVAVVGTIPSMTITEGIPEGWGVSGISHNGVVSDGNIIWSFTNQSESVTLTYNAIPPRLIRNRVAGFSGSVDSGDGEERITGDTAISILLPYLYREAVDYDFSGSPVDGKKYPTGTELGVLYAEGMDGIPSDTVYTRPTANNAKPNLDQTFNFPTNADFHQNDPTGGHGESYIFAGYRDEGEALLEHGASDTGNNIGALDPGDWFRYTFNLGAEDQVLMVNLSVNTWGLGGDAFLDVYVDNKYKGTVQAAATSFNAFTFYTVGPFEVGAGEHSIVLALPSGMVVPVDVGRMEVVRVQGIGQVERTLTADGFFQPGQPIEVTLKATTLYGNYTPFIDEILPPGVEVTAIGTGGTVEGSHILFTLDPTTTSRTVKYTINTPAGSKFLLFEGLADVGLPLADRVYGDTSVTNQVWLFGENLTEIKTDAFAGSSLQAPWQEQYGTDPSLATDYTDGVEVFVSDGKLNLNVDIMGVASKFDEYSNGRRAPMIVRTDIPSGDWRMEADIQLVDVLFQTEFATGFVVAYNDNNDTNVSGDEYLFGFYQGEIQVEFTNMGNRGTMYYHNYADEFEWFDAVGNGDVHARFGITKRADNLIFSVKLPNRSWQLVGAPVVEKRTPTRVGFYTKVWGSENYANASFDNFQLAKLDLFVGVEAWELY